MAGHPNNLEHDLRSMILGNIRMTDSQHSRHHSSGHQQHHPSDRGPPMAHHGNRQSVSWQLPPALHPPGLHPPGLQPPALGHPHPSHFAPPPAHHHQHHHVHHGGHPHHPPHAHPHGPPSSSPGQSPRGMPHGNSARGRGHHSPRPQQPPSRQVAPPSRAQVNAHQHHQSHPDPQPHWRGSSNQQPRGRGAPRGTPRGNAFKPVIRPPVLTMEALFAQSKCMESMATAEMPSMQMSDDEWATKDSFRLQLERFCMETAAEHYSEPVSLSLPAFGSFASTFGMPGSDMDLALVAPSLPGFPRHIERTLLDAGLGARLLTRTRVPILKICENPTPELLAALLAERQKWDEMTPEERKQHDLGNQRKDEPKEASKDSETTGVAKPSIDKSKASDVESVGNYEITLVADLPEASLTESPIEAPLPSRDSFPRQPHTQSTTSSTNTNASSSHQDSRDSKDSKDPKDSSAKPRRERPWLREKAAGPLDFPKGNEVGIQCDINFSTTLGLHNTALLRCYGATDTRVRPLVLFVKRWASRRKINSGYNGTLSSYGYVLMALHFLANVANPPVAPNLQMVETHSRPDPRTGLRVYRAPASGDAASVVDGCDVRFWRSEAQIRARAAQGLLNHNRDGLGHLLRNFFVYYASQGGGAPAGGFNWMADVLSLRTPGGLRSKAEKGWTGARTTDTAGRDVRHRYLLAIEDPFELGHNVARTVTHHGIVAIRDEFRRVARILERVAHGVDGPDGHVLDALVEAVVEPEPANVPAVAGSDAAAGKAGDGKHDATEADTDVALDAKVTTGDDGNSTTVTSAMNGLDISSPETTAATTHTPAQSNA